MLVYISDLLTSVADVRAQSALHASLSGDLVVPRTQSRAWNRLPTDLKLQRSTTTFYCSTLPMDNGKQTDNSFVMHLWSIVGGAIHFKHIFLFMLPVHYKHQCKKCLKSEAENPST